MQIALRIWNPETERMLTGYEAYRRIEGTVDKFQLIIEYIPGFVMLSTGLKDKNGKLVYDGDIVKSFGDLHEIYWDDESAGFYKCPLGKKGQGFTQLRNIQYAEIAGNIYQPPATGS